MFFKYKKYYFATVSRKHNKYNHVVSNMIVEANNPSVAFLRAMSKCDKLAELHDIPELFISDFKRIK